MIAEDLILESEVNKDKILILSWDTDFFSEDEIGEEKRIELDL